MNTRNDDKIGTDFSHRTAESHTPNIGIIKPQTLKPHDERQMEGGKTLEEYQNDKHVEMFFKPKKRWSKNRRLSTNSRTLHRTAPLFTKWQFSTAVQPAMSEA